MIIAGTGHRPNKLGGYDSAITRALERMATDWLIEHKPSLVISGMALGWDQALAQAAIDLKIPFDAYIPFEGQESKWPSISQLHFKFLCTQARRVIIVCSGEYEGWKMQERNKRMVKDCNKILALWDGTRGGTGACIAYANSCRRPVINLWEKWTL